MQLPAKIMEMFRDVSVRKANDVYSTWLDDRGREKASLTYGEIWERAGAVAHKLWFELGSQKGDRILLCYGFGLEFFVAILACFRGGLVAVPVYPPNPRKLDASLKKLQLIMDDSGAKVCLTDNAITTFKRVQSLDFTSSAKWPKGLKWFCTESVTKGESFDESRSTDSDLAFLQYTSGSTGNPKGVMISFGNLFHNVCGIIAPTLINSVSVDEMVGVSWLPQYHDMGLMIGIMR